VGRVNRTAGIISTSLLGVLLIVPSARAAEYTVEILFEGGLPQAFAKPGDVVRAELWLDVPRRLGLYAYAVSVAVSYTEPRALIAGATGFPPEGLSSLGPNPRSIYQPGSPRLPSYAAPSGVVTDFSAAGPLGSAPGGVRQGRFRIGEIDIHVPCTPNLAVDPIVPASQGFIEYDRSNGKDYVLRGGLILIDTVECDGQVLLGLSGNNVEMGNPVLITWSLDHVHRCETSGGWQASLASSGEVEVRVTETTEYGFHCLSDLDDGLVEALVMVEVYRPPAAHIWLEPPRVAPGEATTINWTSEHSTSCWVRVPGTPSSAYPGLGPSGSLPFSPMTDDYRAEIGCEGEAGLISAVSWAPFAVRR
jgi:hypothetical protein